MAKPSTNSPARHTNESLYAALHGMVGSNRLEVLIRPGRRTVKILHEVRTAKNMNPAQPPQYIPESQLKAMHVGDVLMFCIPEKKGVTFFVSRQDDSPAMKAVAAMRHQFGGHAVKVGPPLAKDT